MSRTEGQSSPPTTRSARRSWCSAAAGSAGSWSGRCETAGFRCVVIDRDPRKLEDIAKTGAVTMFGDAANPHILEPAGLARARVLIVAIGDPLTARLATERALRNQSAADGRVEGAGRREIDALRGVGAGRVADPEAEAAFELARHALQRMGVSGPELTGILTGLRRDAYGR